MSDNKITLTSYYDAMRRPQILLLHGTEVDWDKTLAIGHGQTAHEASFHYAISQKGEVVQFLDDNVRAWHAGKGYWGGFEDINSLSIGIELECVCKDSTFQYPENTYAPVQMDALKELALRIIAQHKIKPHHVLAHQDTSPQRKMDPGVNFDWAGLGAAGIGVWHGLTPTAQDIVIDDPQTAQEFRVLLGLYGYDVRASEGQDFEKVIRAFQTHFLPWNICGQVTEQSIDALQTLLEMKHG